MSIKLDLGRAQYIGSDDKSTTIKHPGGHTTRIFHSVLSPDNQKMLKAMATRSPQEPDYGKIIKKAGGGGVGAPGSYAPTTNTAPKDDVKNQMDTAPSTASGWMDRIVEGVTSDKDHAKGGMVKMAKGGRLSIGDDYNHSGPGSESMATYDAGLPCLNPHCKSHGKPHPNCRCYSGGEQFSDRGSLAEGGEVKPKMRYCAHGKPHMEGCSYAKGGEVKYNNPKLAEAGKKKLQEKHPGSKPEPHKSELNVPASNKLPDNYAKGGGISEQGADIRYANKVKESDPDKHEIAKDMAKMEAQGRAEFERKAIKPKLKGLADGGGPENAPEYQDKLAQENTAPAPDERPSLGQVIGEAVRHAMGPAESRTVPIGQLGKAPEPQQAQPAAPPADPNFNSVTGQTNAQPPEAQDDNANTPAVEDQPQAQLDRSDNYGHMASEPQSQQPQGQPDQSMPDQPQNAPLSQQLQQEDAAWAQDLANQHITPKTYADLYADKSTLGKIGQIFGLMLGGIGGVKTGTNSAMQMMDKIIERDLEAQKASKTNAHNFLNQTYQHELQQAQARGLDASSANVQQEAQLKAYTLSRMYATRSAYQDIVNKLKNMPDGPNKDAAIQAATVLGSQLDTSHKNLADQAQALQMSLNGGAGSEQAFQREQQTAALSGNPQMQAAAQLKAARHIPGVPGQASRDIPEDIRQRLQAQSVLDNKGKDVLSYVEQHKGTWNPQTRAVAAQKIEEMKNFYNDSIKGGALTQGRLGWYDEQFAKHPTDILSQLMGSTAKLKEMVGSNANRRNMELKGLGFPVQTQSAPNSKEIRYDKQGNAWQQGPNGFPMRVQ